WPLLGDCDRNFGESLRQPAFRRPVLGTGTKSELCRGAVSLNSGEKLSPFRGRLGCAELARHSQITINLMLNRTEPLFLGDDLVQKPATTMAGKTYAAGNAGEAHLESGAERAREKDRHV